MAVWFFMWLFLVMLVIVASWGALCRFQWSFLENELNAVRKERDRLQRAVNDQRNCSSGEFAALQRRNEDLEAKIDDMHHERAGWVRWINACPIMANGEIVPRDTRTQLQSVIQPDGQKSIPYSVRDLTVRIGFYANGDVNWPSCIKIHPADNGKWRTNAAIVLRSFAADLEANKEGK